MKRFKNNNRYTFKKLSIPLGYYIYYRKKNNKASRDVDFLGNNYIIEDRIAPIVSAIINQDTEKLKILYKYLDFIQNEFKDIFKSLNNIYQRDMIGFLTETVVSLFYRSLDLSKEVVYKFYDKY